MTRVEISVSARLWKERWSASPTRATQYSPATSFSGAAGNISEFVLAIDKSCRHGDGIGCCLLEGFVLWQCAKGASADWQFVKAQAAKH